MVLIISWAFRGSVLLTIKLCANCPANKFGSRRNARLISGLASIPAGKLGRALRSRLGFLAEVRLGAKAQDLGAGPVSQLDRGVPIRSRRLKRGAQGRADGPAAEQPLALAQHRARAAQSERHHRSTGLRGHGERPHLERQQARRAAERALGKYDEGTAGAHRFDEASGVLDAAFDVEPLDEFGADALEIDSRDEVLEQLALGYEGHRAGEGADQDKAVDEARVVYGDQAGAVGGKVFEAAHGEPHAGEPQVQTERMATEPPAPAGARQESACRPRHRSKDA